VRRLATRLLEAPNGPLPAREIVAVNAVMGTIIWSGLTLPGLCEALSTLRREQLELEAGVLVLPGTSFPGQRFVLDPRSAVLWGQLLLLRARRPDWEDPPGDLVLPPEVRDPRQLRARIRQMITTERLGCWTAFMTAVQLRLLCDGVPPMTIWHRTGRLSVTTALTAESRVLARPGRPFLRAESKRLVRMRQLPFRQCQNSLNPPWRVPVKQILRGLRRRGAPCTRRQMAMDVEQLIGDSSWGATAGIIGLLFCQWTIALLKGPRRQNTIRAYLGRVGRAVDAGTMTDAVVSSESGEEATASVHSSINLYGTEESRRSALRVFRAFLGFASSRGYPVGQHVKWRRLARNIEGTTGAAPLLTPAEIRAAAVTLRGRGPDGLGLAVAVVLGGCGGLRRAEICDLSLDDVQAKSPWVIHVRRTKTRAGVRRVPLGAVSPAWALEILEAYEAHRATLRTKSHNWLLRRTGTAWDPDAVGERVSRVLWEVSEKPATFHSLRRACATWWLVCWISHDRQWGPHPQLGADGPPTAGVLAVLGKDSALALWSLARILGHVVPAVTVERYILDIDWVEAQVFSVGARAPIPRRMAAEFLAVTERRARDLVSVDDTFVTAGQVLAAQRRRLRSLEDGGGDEG
jgi:integrase